MPIEIKIYNKEGKEIFVVKTANLSGANLSGANLTGANLTRAYLYGANLTGADLTGADLTGANLTGANLTRAYLYGANLTGADLTGADLTGANLTGANLTGADLTGADLTGANLYGAKLPSFQIPQEGSLIVFKKLTNCVAKLKIPSEAKRTATPVGRKCRAEFALVLECSTGAKDRYSETLNYIQNQIVCPDSYNDDIRVECTHGIHFFLTREEAEAYN